MKIERIKFKAVPADVHITLDQVKALITEAELLEQKLVDDLIKERNNESDVTSPLQYIQQSTKLAILVQILDMIGVKSEIITEGDQA